jgi:hypothetical protein
VEIMSFEYFDGSYGWRRRRDLLTPEQFQALEGLRTINADLLSGDLFLQADVER